MINQTIQKKLSILLCLSALLTGCYYHQWYTGEAIVRQFNLYKYEIQFPLRIEARGNMHNPFDFHKYQGESSNWIYVNSLESRIDGENLIFTGGWACLRGYSAEHPMGYVEFKDGNIFIDFETPLYEKGKLIGNIPDKINGTYKLRFEKEPYVPVDISKEWPCDRTGVLIWGKEATVTP
jgi:hypothetical protein